MRLACWKRLEIGLTRWTAEGHHVPNAETAKVRREAREGRNLLHYDSLEEMFKDLGI